MTTHQRLSAKHILINDAWENDKTLIINDGKIQDIVPFNSAIDNPLRGRLVPGFIDVQVNGGGGALFNAQPSITGIRAIQKAHRQFGTTAMLPTIITDDTDTMSQAADAIALASDENTSSAQTDVDKVPGIIGVHFEGPFLNTEKKGVHKQAFIRTPSDRDLQIITREDIGRVLLTVAPDCFPIDLISDLVNQGVIISLGHSNASYEQVIEAIDAGATGFTHLYNAMSSLTSREPGMVGAAMASVNTFAGIILDNQHVHPVSARLAINAKSTDKTMLVTDAMAHVGNDATLLPFFDTHIQRKGGRLTIPDGTLAGSCLDMALAVRNAHKHLGISLIDCIKMATCVPAEFLGLAQSKGKIAKQFDADFVLIDDAVSVKQVFQKGRSVYAAN